MLCGSRADKNWALDLVHGRFAAWKFDDKLARAPHLTRETLVGRHAVCPIEQIELVVAGRHQVLEPLAYHDAAACAGQHPTAIVCNIDALTEQMVEGLRRRLSST